MDNVSRETLVKYFTGAMKIRRIIEQLGSYLN